MEPADSRRLEEIRGRYTPLHRPGGQKEHRFKDIIWLLSYIKKLQRGNTKMEPLTDEHLPEDIDEARHGNPELEAAIERSNLSEVKKEWLGEVRATLRIIEEANQHLDELISSRPQE